MKMKKKGYAKGGLPMTTIKGQKIPKFAADGKGANDMKKGIVKRLYNEYDLKFIEVFSKVTDYLYENKKLIDFMAEEIDEIADETINKMEDEGLYKITQKDLGLGVV